MSTFDALFSRALGAPEVRPYAYQRRLAEHAWPDVLIAPTGTGKTAAVVLGWLWRRITVPEDTPRRLVLCLPMRTLVEQTEALVRLWLRRLPGLGSGGRVPDPENGVTVLMGGGEREVTPPAWALRPDHPAVLIGTQDMLLSRALMRGYGMSRFRWPVDFALLHTDAQWVFDEVQAMGAGLACSTQLHGLRRALGTAGPVRSLWVSATLHPTWLETVDHKAPAAVLRVPDDAPEDAADPRMRALLDAPKPLARAAATPAGATVKDIAAHADALAQEVLDAHRPGRTTLVILNTVARAQAVHAALAERMGGAAADRLLLVHSRFRPAERKAVTDRLTGAGADADRIVVATQAIEAGIDLTSSVLFTDLAPWSSLVQRFGRVNRRGECGAAGALLRWIDLDGAKGDLARPYAAEDLAASRERLLRLPDAAPANLPPPAAPAPPRLVLRRRDLLDLFDTDPDLTGFDIDIGAFIRDTLDTDFHVVWRDFAVLPPAAQPLPLADELCAVPIGRAGDLLTKERTGWRLDPQATRHGDPPTGWMRLDGSRAWPGLVVMLDAAQGGYRTDIGLAPASRQPVPVPAAPPASTTDPGETHDDDRDTRQPRAVALTDHLTHVAGTAAALCDVLKLSGAERAAVLTAARWHDVGKAHASFQERLVRPAGPPGAPLAKAAAYDRTRGRPFFRHELASALAFLAQHGDVADADLVAYLIAAHHGKVRLSLRALPAESAPPGITRFARGVWENDPLPRVDLGDGTESAALALTLDLMELGDGPSGPSWAARTHRLLAQHGPFRLAWLEALVRIADWQGSATEQKAAEPKEGVHEPG